MSDRDRTKPPARYLPDEDRREEITDRMTLIDDPFMRAALLRLQERADQIAGELRDESAEGMEQMRTRTHKLANDVQGFVLQLERLQVELTGRNGGNGKVGALLAATARLEARQDDEIRARHEVVNRIGNRVIGALAGAVVAMATAIGAAYAAGGATGAENSDLRQVIQTTREIRTRQDQLIAAMCRVDPGACAGLFSPGQPAPLGRPQ